MILTDEQILDIIKKFYNDKTIKYAVLLDGEWGSGKTYFIKNKLCAEIPNSVYISLYGMNKLSDINKSILYTLFRKKVGIFASCCKGIKIGYDALYSPISKYTKISIPNLKNIDSADLMSRFVDVSECLIIIDDLERVSMPINDVLGIINDYVEHKNAKVVIVANEKEIERISKDSNYELKVISCMSDSVDYNEVNEIYKTDKKSKVGISDLKKRIDAIYEMNNGYKIIKEKLIGKTIAYNPNIDAVFDNMLKKYCNDCQYHSFLVDNKGLLLNLLDQNKCNNLRTLEFIITGYHEIYNAIRNQLYDAVEEKIIKLTYINFIHMSILLKNGVNISKKLKASYSNIPVFLGNAIQKDSDYFVAFDFVNDYLMYSILDAEKMKNTLAAYINNEINNALPDDDPYFILQEYWELEDSEIEKCLSGILYNIENVYSFAIYPKLLRTLSGLKAMNVFVSDVDMLINAMKNKLIVSKEDTIIFYESIKEGKVSGKTDDVYDNYVQIFNDIIINNKNYNNNSKISSALLEKNWGENLYNYYTKDNCIHNEGFFRQLNINLLINNIKKGTVKEIWNFIYTVKAVYRFDGLKKYYQGDKDNIELTIQKLEKLKINKKNNRTKIFAIEHLLSILKDNLELLK